MPNWDMTIDFSDYWSKYMPYDSEQFKEMRDETVERIRSSAWDQHTAYPFALENTTFLLAQAESVEEFDAYFSRVYDIADLDRVWLKTQEWQ